MICQDRLRGQTAGGNSRRKTGAPFFRVDPSLCCLLQWKDRYWQEPLGLEHTSWGNPLFGLNCGAETFPVEKDVFLCDAICLAY